MNDGRVQKKIDKENEDPMAAARAKLEQINNTPSTRKVRLRLTLRCGCGEYDYEIERTVPYNSPLKDGDVIYDVMKRGDKEVGLWKD